MLEPKVIYEDKNFLAIDKPAGMLVHSAANRKSRIANRGQENAKRQALSEPTLVDWLLKNYPEVKNVGDDPESRPGIVHRLDKDTSGVMVIAKNKKYFEHLKSLFKNHEVKKIYLAVVSGLVREKKGIIEKQISIKSDTTKRTVYAGKMPKTAITEYKVFRQLERGSEKFTLLEVYPKTGRTHQIRVHLASIGHPIVGDALYGKAQSAKREALGHNDLRYAPSDTPRLMLHALSLEFSTAGGKRIKIESEPPANFNYIINGLED